MDFILSFNNGYQNGSPQLIFPVVPNGGINLQRGQTVDSFDGVNGEMVSIGNMELATFEIESIFPNKKYDWMRPGSSIDGWNYVKTIEDVRLQKIPFRAVMLNNGGSEVFNIPVTVTDFTYGIDRAGDITYKLSFKEYRFATMPVTGLGSNPNEGLRDAESYAISAQETAGGDLAKAGTAPAILRYTDADAIALAKTMYGEANGLPTVEVACVGWCICNRVDDSRFPNTVTGVIVQKSQFDGYKASHPSSNFYNLAKDVLNRWSREFAGETDVGRVMPKGYVYFNGYQGHNWHTKTWHNSPSGYYNDPDKWDYHLTNPY